VKDFFSELKRRNVVRVGIAYAVLAWVLIQAADILLPTFGAPEGFLKGFYILLALLFPIVLFFSWAFEITPEGVKKTKEVDKSKSVTHGTGQKINKLIAGGLVVALGFIAYNQFFSSGHKVQEAEAANASIAVLPFVNMSSDPEQDYFSDGISEELLNLLAKIPELQVAGRTSSFAFKGQNQDLRKIGDTLGVSFLLEGSVRKQNDQVRITAQLIRSSDGIHLWSETYDRKLDDVFGIQDEISSAIVTELQSRILGNISAPVTQAQKVNPEAHSLYLLGLQRQNQRASQPYLDAREYFRRALEISPDYLDALWGLGYVQSDLADWGTIENAEAKKGIEEVLNRVQQLGAGDDPKVLALKSYLAHLDGNHDVESELSLQAYAANPNDPRFIGDAAEAYTRNRNDAKALETLEKGLARDPLSLQLLGALVGVQLNLNLLSEAETTIKKMLEIDPAYSDGYAQLAILDFNLGKWGESLENWQKVRALDPIDPDIPTIIGSVLRAAGFYDEAAVYLDEADAMSPNEVLSIANRASILAAKGEYGTAGLLAESLLLSGRENRLSSNSIATGAAIYTFTQTKQFERLERLALAQVPDFSRPLREFRQDGDTILLLNRKISHADDLAYALIGEGRDEEARALLEKAVEVFMDINPDAKTSDAIKYHLILLGRYDEAVRRLSLPENISNTMLIFSDKVFTWRLDPLKGRPDFEALAARITPRVEGERAKIRAWLDAQKTK